MRISLYRNSIANITSTEEITDWDEFVDLVGRPVIGQKNGDYFIRGYCSEGRDDEHMKSMDLIIIDGDQTLTDGKSCIPPTLVHDVLVERAVTHVIYSSFSNDIVNNRHKWRCCIPCDGIVDADSLRQGVEEIITLLHERQLWVRNVKENLVLSQPWFTPRCPYWAHDDFYAAWYDGEPWKLTGHTIPSARFSEGVRGEQKGSSHQSFSWDYVIGQFKAGTLHQGIKSATGWLIYTTNWKDSQIKAHLSSIIRAVCPDQEKVARACDGTEIEKLVKYCREKAGKDEPQSANWKDFLTDAAVLEHKEFPPIKWAVDEIIPEGLCLLAGAPKSGKSLMAIDICGAIAGGLQAFDRQNCVAGTVCYLSMESPEREVRDRIRQQRNLWPANFKVLTQGMPRIGPEFYKILEEMTFLWSDLRAVVIDTLQLVVPPKPIGQNDYDFYYGFLAPLHSWATVNHIALVLITHTTKGKKGEDENPFDSIIGSQAIQANADAMLLLRKNHAKGTILNPELADGFLEVTGRGQATEKFSLDWNSEAIRWSMRGESKPEEHTGNTNWMIIVDALKRERMASKKISEVTKINRATVRTVLHRLKEKKILIRHENGEWEVFQYEYKTEREW